ncbi:MAG: flavodoxin family protein [Anaerolineae bacterium]|jgi:flavodoxin
MKTLVVYDSLYGNTETIARTIAQALPGDVPVVRAGQANPAELATADLLIIGAPTHGSLPSETAQDLIQRIGSPARQGAKLATFDTRLAWGFLKRYGFAASKMADPLVEKGWALAAEPEGFIVRGLKKGPLKRGEVERASAWAKQLAESLV